MRSWGEEHPRFVYGSQTHQYNEMFQILGVDSYCYYPSYICSTHELLFHSLFSLNDIHLSITSSSFDQYTDSKKPDSFDIEMKSGNSKFSSTSTKSAGEATRVSILELRRLNAKNVFKLEGETNGDDSMSFTLRVVQPCCK